MSNRGSGKRARKRFAHQINLGDKVNMLRDETSVTATVPADSQRAENKPGAPPKQRENWIEEQRKRFGIEG